MRRHFFTAFLLLSTVIVFSMTTCLSQTRRQPRTAHLDDSLKGYLQAFDKDRDTQYIVAFYDLNGDGKPEAIVRLISREWCGSGGCNTLILAQDGESWRIVSKITITRPPIRVLEKISNGWHNLTFLVQGGGINPGYEAEFHFDGTTYAPNPSVRPGGQLRRKAPGKVVISPSEEGKPLYP